MIGPLISLRVSLVLNSVLLNLVYAEFNFESCVFWLVVSYSLCFQIFGTFGDFFPPNAWPFLNPDTFSQTYELYPHPSLYYLAIRA